jgi:hypothetical protein
LGKEGGKSKALKERKGTCELWGLRRSGVEQTEWRGWRTEDSLEEQKWSEKKKEA